VRDRAADVRSEACARLQARPCGRRGKGTPTSHRSRAAFRCRSTHERACAAGGTFVRAPNGSDRRCRRGAARAYAERGAGDDAKGRGGRLWLVRLAFRLRVSR
jgi:hypothetical protein